MSRNHAQVPDRFSRTGSRRRLRLAVLLAALCVGVFGAVPAMASPQTATVPSQSRSVGWVGTWNATPMTPPSPSTNSLGVPLTFTNQTLRQIVQPHLSSPVVRIQLSNRYGAGPVTFADAHVAKQVPGATTIPPGLPTVPTDVPGQLVGAATLAGAIQGAGTVPGSDKALTFAGKPTVTVPAGGSVYSDPVLYPVRALEPLTVSVHLPTLTGLATEHTIGNQVNYVAPGDVSASPSTVGFVPLGISYAFLSDVEVVAQNPRSVVALGDSLTDGLMSTINANHRYPDYLAARLAPKGVSVLNQGVAGQRLLFDNIGPSSLNSFDLNVATNPNAKYMIVQVGINDLANPPFIGTPVAHPERISSQQVIAGMKQLVAKAHAKGIKVFATTITPSGDLLHPDRGLFTTYSLPDVVQKRMEVNQFIRTPGTSDGVIDFDAVLRDPTSPNSLKPQLASADGLHPNDAGYKAMADSVNLALFN